ncbi:protein saal1 [Conger conger]|uniref:protein saal1 n=1 Tax=Conger conger TaxID=82655 RepID=UPI002A59D5D2|nr:protein saal1 [Conger conger]
MEASAEAGETGGSSPDSDSYPHSPRMDRNPSPPPSHGSEPEVESDSIGETLYSKHWLFSTLTSLIQTVTEQEDADPEAQVDLSKEDEEKLCKIWDMAMDKDVAGLLQEFKASDILLGAIAKSRSPRLTEIWVGILGNMACFPDTCLSISQNEDLGVVLLLLLGDSDPPTILETSRLLLTCLAQPGVAPIWLERVLQQASVCPSLCFIMCSSTNVDLLVKVGELVHKLFDLDEGLMECWVSARPSDADTGSQLHIAPSLLEAAKQVRLESSEGLEVYLHVLQLLTTVDEGVEALVELAGTGEEIWAALCEVVCDDLCQPDDPPVILQEQKGRLAPALAVLSTLSACSDQEYSQTGRNLPLLGTLLRVLQFLRECQQRAREGQDEDGSGNGLKEEEDMQMSALRETAVEFLASMLTNMTKDTMLELLMKGYLGEQACLAAAGSLLPDHRSEVQHLVDLLSEAQSGLSDVVRQKFPELSS